MPQARDWLHSAQSCFADEGGFLQQGFLTSVFAVVVGLERIFHLDQMEDVGFALLCGGRRCPSRHSVGGWRRQLRWYEVDAFCRRTSPCHGLSGHDALVSFDEHTLPRWTKKYRIGKGYVTTRNKYMRCEKLFYAYDVERERYLGVLATPGNVELRDLARPLIQRVRLEGQPRRLHALFDAGAGKADADVRALLDLAARTDDLTVTLRACRYPHRVRAWKQLPSGLFVSYEEPAAYVGAPPKKIRLAETQTVLKDETEEQAVRTIVCRQVLAGPKKDRWHPLYTSSEAEAREVLETFRQRQHHEQAYRIGVHDQCLNAAPCGYDKDSADPKRPRFPRAPLQMIGWLVALVYNTLADVAGRLAGDYEGCHVRTLRRTFINRPGQLLGTPEALIVQLDPFAEQQALIPLIDQFNKAEHRLPWLDNRRLVISLTPRGRPQAIT